MARASRSDVARLAGVAPTTVSNVLNGRAEALRISPATVERIRAAAQELSYVPQASARALRGSPSRTLGLLLAALPPSPYVPVVYDVLTAAIVQAQLREHLLFPVVQPEHGEDTAYVDQMLADVDLAGVVCEYSPRNALAGQRLVDMDVPVVWMSLDSPSEQRPGIAHVHADERPGVRDVLSRLAIGEDQRLGVLVGPVYRTERLRVADELFPGRVELIEAESWLPDGGMAATRRALTDHRDLGALFCADDLLAVGALHACADLGLTVPDDMSVVGFGGYNLSGYGHSELTTVHWPLRDLAATAIDTLVSRLASPRSLPSAAAAPVTSVLPSTAVVRGSARLAPNPLRGTEAAPR
ncbi:LacI family DNA-binding transcriptional regulator [Streptomyces sp. A0958]|uniref:LacI family DNA-binding transcriptional regulator n=1 Tax=Streptomyces sp. A0958 TaxID=2563101 RepID=UPI001446AB36|nr:LacI family DNA-binding transcriptional regulator [Streptomyces sp. A0958]